MPRWTPRAPVRYALSLALLQAACTGTGEPVKDSDQPVDSEPVVLPGTPTLTLSPAEPTTLDDLVALAEAEADATLSYRWSVNGTQRPDLTTNTVSAEITRKGEQWAVEVIASNELGESAPATASVAVRNSPPVATVTLSPESPSSLDLVTAEASATDADGDTVALSYAWTLNGGASSFTGTELPVGSTSRGQVWKVLVTPTDSQDAGEVAEAEVRIENAPPVVTAASVTPVAPRSNGTLTATHAASDPDGDTLTYSYEWFVDGSPVAGQTARTLTGAWFTRDDVVSFTVTAHDGQDASAPFPSGNFATVINTAPTFTTVTLSATTVVEGGVLTCSASGWSDLDDDPPGWRWSWYVNDGLLPGLEDATLDSSHFSRGQQVACGAQAWDGGLGSDVLISVPAVVLNSPPSLTSVQVSNLSPRIDSLISATPVGVNDPDGDDVTLSYAWFLSGTQRATGPALQPGSFVAGETFYVEVTPHDGLLAGPTVRSATGIIANTPPVVTNATISPSSPLTGDALVAFATGTDANLHPLTFTYEWTVNGGPATGATGNRLPASSTQRGDVIRVEVVAHDGFDPSTRYTSNPVTIGNTPPELASALLGPAGATVATELSCTPGAWTDEDGDQPGYRYSWTVGGATVAGASSSVLRTGFARNQSVRCVVTPDDGRDLGDAVQSNALVIANAVPTLASVSLTTTTPGTNDTLGIIPNGSFDADGDTVTYRYQWYVDGAPTGTSATLPGTAFRQGQQIYVDVTPYDGIVYGTTRRSNTATVVNVPPSITAVTLGPTPASTTTDLTCAWTGSDTDNDPLVPTFAWWLNGQLVTGVTGDQFAAANQRKNDSVRCDVTITDGYVVAGPVSSATVTIANTAPTIASAAISPTIAYLGTDLSCTPSGWFDADGDQPAYIYRWRRDGVVVGSQATLSGNAITRGNVVTCGVTPTDNDAGGRGTEVISAPLTVRNTPPQLVSASLTRTSPTVADTLGVTYAGATDGDGDTLTPTIAWYVEGQLVSAAATLPGTFFQKGDQIQAEVRVFDGFDASAPVWSDVAVAVNSPPRVLQVTFFPNEPTAVTSVTVEALADDLDGDDVSFEYTWTVDGVQVQTSSDPVLHHSTFVSGDVVRVNVVPFDGEHYGPAFLSAPIVIANTPPTVQGTALTPSEVYETTTASCDPYGWYDEDGDPEGYHWEWWVAGVNVSASRTISGSRFNRGQSMYCVAIPFDGTSEGDPVQSSTITVRNSPPTAFSATLSRLTPAEGQTINVIVSSPLDADGDTITYGYRWFVNGAQVSTAATLTSSSFNKRDTIYAQVELRDGTDVTTLTTPTVTAVNTAPVVSSVTLSPLDPRTNDTLTASAAASDADGDPITLTYTWTVAGQQVAGVTGNLLNGSYFSKGQLVAVAVSGFDGEGTGTPASSNPVRVLNTAPTATTVSVTPTTITKSSVVQCNATGLSDADDDFVSVQYRWDVNGVERIASSNLSNSLFTRGDVVQCFATPFDGEDTGEAIASTQYTVQNSLPVVGSVVLNNVNPTETSTVIATASGVTDADNDIVELSYRWEVNGVTVTTTNAVNGLYFSRGDTLRAYIRPYDGAAFGAETASQLLTVGNSAPYLPDAPSLLPTPAYTTDNLIATAAGADADPGDTVTLTYTWTVAGAVVQTGSSNVLGASFHRKGQSVRVQVTPFDGTVSGPMRESPARTISNTPPLPPTVALNATTLTPGVTPLICTIAAAGYDPDTGDQTTYQFRFTKGAIDWPATSTSNLSSASASATIAANYITAASLWGCQARVFDGTINSQYSTAVYASSFTFDPASCNDHLVYGARTDGLYELYPPEEKPYEAWCDQHTAGGGWTRVARTTSHSLDVGQRGWSLVDRFADPLDERGVYEAFAAVRDFTEVMIVQTDGAQAGEHARYSLFRPPTGWSLLELLESCRDEAPLPGLDGVFAAPGVLGHTHQYSATRTGGGLLVSDPSLGGLVPPAYLHLCGVHEAGDNATSYLAFTAQRGDGPGWSAPWWGASQPGTLWSFASGPYSQPGDAHLGTPSMLGLAGWKAATPTDAIWHEGSYELYVR